MDWLKHFIINHVINTDDHSGHLEVNSLEQGMTYAIPNNMIEYYSIKNKVDGKLHGIKASFCYTGALTSLKTYKNDKLNGPYIDWYCSCGYTDCNYKKIGHISIYTTYSNNKKHGLYLSWHAYGKLNVIALFMNGKVQINSNDSILQAVAEDHIRVDYRSKTLFGSH